MPVITRHFLKVINNKSLLITFIVFLHSLTMAPAVNAQAQCVILPIYTGDDPITGRINWTVKIENFHAANGPGNGTYTLVHPEGRDYDSPPRQFIIDDTKGITFFEKDIVTLDNIYPDRNNKWVVTDSNGTVVCEWVYEVPIPVANRNCVADNKPQCLVNPRKTACVVKTGAYCCSDSGACQDLTNNRGEETLCSVKMTAKLNHPCVNGKFCSDAKFCGNVLINPSSPAITAQQLDDIDPLKQLGNADSPDSIGTALTRFLTFFAFPIAGLILFVMLVWGGFEILAQSATKKSIDAGKQRITNALVGFFLLFASYWIAQLIEVIFGITIL